MSWNDEEITFSSLLGKTIASIQGAEKGSDEIVFTLSNGEQFKLYHSQDCCESVSVEDVCGNVSDLLGQPLGIAECVSNAEPPLDTDQEPQDCDEWTFYKLATNKGAVTLRWFGSSNGYYSTEVSFIKITN